MTVNIYTVISFIGCVIMFVIASMSRSDEQPYSTDVRILLQILGAWLFFEMLYYSVAGHTIQLSFDRFRYIAITFVPLCILLTVHKFLFNKKINLYILIGISLIPIISLILLFTNSSHHLFFTDRFIVYESGIYYVRNIYGVFYKYVFLSYSYIAISVAFIWSLISIYKFRDNKRKQALVILVALTIPVLGNFAYVFIESFPKSVDYTPLLFVLTGILFYMSIRQYGFLNVVPFAKEIVIDEMADAMIILDSEDKILQMNDAAKFIFEDLYADVVFGEYLARYLEDTDIDPDEFHKRSYDKTTVKVDVDLSTIHYYVRDRIIHDKKGRNIGRILLMHDISDLKEAMDSLEIEKQKAEEATKAKSRFVANISHEIRTPMTAIIGMTDMLTHASDKEEHDRLVNNIQTSTKLLLQIVNDLLDLSKIEAGRLELKPRPFSIRDLVRETKDLIHPLLSGRPIVFNHTFDEELPEYLMGDSLRLRQVLINLLSNATKYTEKGSIDFSVHLEKKGETHITLCFQVKDTGIGISPVDQEKLFDLFFQVEHSNTRRFAGSGLGLAITKQLVDQMNGTLLVESELHQGSVFTLRLSLPYLKNKTESPKVETLYDLKKLNILLAEDNKMNQEYMKLIFKKMGCHYALATNGQEAVDMAKTWTYDVILMDIQMPEMDGHEATKQIRHLEQGRHTATDGSPPPKPIPIVALTANDTEDDRMQAQLAGMDGFLSKPFTYKKLVQVIEELKIFKIMET